MMPNPNRVWFKKRLAKRERVNTMPAVKRAQLVIQTWAGDVVTSIQYEFEGVTNEFITLASFQWLIGIDDHQLAELLARHELITREKFGQRWVNCSDVLPWFGWTPK